MKEPGGRRAGADRSGSNGPVRLSVDTSVVRATEETSAAAAAARPVPASFAFHGGSSPAFIPRGGEGRRGARRAPAVYRTVRLFPRARRARVSRRWEEWEINNRNRPYRLSRATGPTAAGGRHSRHPLPPAGRGASLPAPFRRGPRSLSLAAARPPIAPSRSRPVRGRGGARSAASPPRDAPAIEDDRHYRFRCE